MDRTKGLNTMATTPPRANTRAKSGRYRIARLTPDSPDPDARADANNPALMAELAASARRARESGEWLTQGEMEAKDPLTPEEEAEAAALRKDWEAQDRAAGIVENASVRPSPAARRPTGRRPNSTGDVSGRLVVRFPKSIYRELVQRAEAEGVSLNQLVVAYVSRCLGAPQAAARS